MEDLIALKQLYDHGFLSESEFNRRRLEIIDRLTNTKTTGPVGGAASPLSKPQLCFSVLFFLCSCVCVCVGGCG